MSLFRRLSARGSKYIHFTRASEQSCYTRQASGRKGSITRRPRRGREGDRGATASNVGQRGHTAAHGRQVVGRWTTPPRAARAPRSVALAAEAEAGDLCRRASRRRPVCSAARAARCSQVTLTAASQHHACVRLPCCFPSVTTIGSPCPCRMGAPSPDPALTLHFTALSDLHVDAWHAVPPVMSLDDALRVSL